MQGGRRVDGRTGGGADDRADDRAERRADGRPTLDAVAARAGVGRGTVSRVINGAPNVSEVTREAVERAIAELRYVPNHAARSLVTRRTNTVALVVCEAEDRLWGEPYFAGIIRGISSGLSDTGFQLLLAIARTQAERDQLEGYLTGHHVDGVLLTSLHGADPLPARLEAGGVPTVLGGAPLAGEPVACVDVDNRGGARSAVEHLIERGRQKIVTVAGPQDMRVGVDRLAGYHDAIERSGAKVRKSRIGYGDFRAESGAGAIRSLLRRTPDLDAVFAASDAMAIGAMRVLREAGRQIPDDVAVVGFDDSSDARHASPPMTSVHQPMEAMGRAMARVLVARISGEDPVRSMVLDTHLVVRDSS